MSETKRKSANGGTIPAAEMSAKPKPELTKAQQFVCDEVSELLFSGGSEGDLNALLSVALSSAWRRFANGSASFSEADREKNVAQDLTEYRLDIIASWKRNEQSPPEAAQPASKAIADRISARVSNELREYFERFANEAGPADRKLLLDVLFTWDMVARARTSLDCPIDLGEAFARQLGSESTYLEVPARHMEDVADYARLLQKTDRTAA